MAVIEKDGLYQYIDESGNIYILYPVTKLDNVSGTGKLVHLKDGTTLQTLDGTNIALVTAADLKALSNTANADTRVQYVDNVLKTLGGMEIVTGNARIATGSYVGTGAKGSESPNSLTFDFEPKVVIFYSSWYVINPYVWGTDLFNASRFNSGASNVYVTINGNTMTWYSTDSTAQLNKSGIIYQYVAIG